ncbi:hypothetical protein INT43_007655, partial [Umbelopsis isabellina]
MVKTTLLAALLYPLAAFAHEAMHAHPGEQLVLTPTKKFSCSLRTHHPQAESLLASQVEYDEDHAHVKKFTGDTLAYVTPWNNHGYDVVKQFKGKFDYVSPVWFYIDTLDDGEFTITGAHDVDRDWMDEVRTVVDGRKVGKIVPRFQFRGWNRERLQAFVKSPSDAKMLAKHIFFQVGRHGFDGIVLECGFPSFFGQLLKELSIGLHQEGLELLVVLPPVRDDISKEIMSAEVFAALGQIVDRFSLMSYDYSSGNPAGGPSSPIDWIEDNIEHLTNEDNRHKLLVGINMYAMSYKEGEAPEAKVMNSVLDIIREMHEDGTTVDLVWDKENEEHNFQVSQDDGLTEGPTIWLPTPKYIKSRVHLAEDWGVGLALWEVGQGLDGF